jgi:hypothetical protein
MALDVWLNGVGELPYLEIAHRMEHIDAFDYDDGCFHHLSRYWARLEEDFGLIDPFDSVAFHGAGLDALIECLKEARIDATTLPEAWSIHVGTRMSDPPEACYTCVQKNQLLHRIDRLLDASQRARAAGNQLLFFGD